MLIVKIDRYAPFEGAAADAEILKPGEQEIIEHLLCAGCGLNEIGMLVYIVDEPRSILADAEEIALLLNLLNGTAAVGADSAALLELRFGPECFAGRAVHALIAALIDIALVVELFECLLNACNVVIIGGADKAVVGNIHELPELMETADDIIDVFLRRYALFRSFALDLLTVLVRAGEEIGIITGQALVSCHCIGIDGAVGVPDMQVCARVIDGGRYIKGFLFHFQNSLQIIKFLGSISREITGMPTVSRGNP